MKRVNAQSLFSYAIFLLSVSVALLSQAGWKDAPDWNGTPPFVQEYPNEHQFLAACRQGRPDIAAYWLGHDDFDPDREFSNGWVKKLKYQRVISKMSGLFVAAARGHKAVVEMLINAKANVNKACDDDKGKGMTPLVIASYYGHNDVVQLLIEKGADLNKSTKGATALVMAGQNGYPDIVRALVEAKANPLLSGDFFDPRPLTSARVQRFRVLQWREPERYAAYTSAIKILKSSEKIWNDQEKVLAEVNGNAGCLDGPCDIVKHNILEPLMRQMSLGNKVH